MASGYTMASGKLGGVFAQSGPGVTNTITGIGAAFMDSVPQVILGTQAPLGHFAKNGHQECRGFGRSFSQLDSIQPLVAQTYSPPTAGSAVTCARQACALALSKRTTTYLELPADILGKQVEITDLKREQFIPENQAVDLNAVRRITDLIADSNSPVFLFGDNLIHRGLTEQLRVLVEENNIGFVTTDFAKGVVPEDSPMCGGIMSISGKEHTRQLVENSDLVVAIGARLSVQSTLNFSADLYKRLVEIDEDPANLNHHYPTLFSASSYLPGFINALTLKVSKKGKNDPILKQIKEKEEKIRNLNHFEMRTSKTFTTTNVLRALRQKLPRDINVVGDSGLNLQFLKRDFPIYKPDGFYNLYGLAAMGAALPLAAGVALAKPNDLTVCVIGDGGILVYLSELALVKELNLRLAVIVINNIGYRQVGDRLKRYYAIDGGCELPQIDLIAAAGSLGINGVRVDNMEKLKSAMDSNLMDKGPVLIEVIVENDSLYDITPPHLQKLHDQLFYKGEDKSIWPFKN